MSEPTPDSTKASRRRARVMDAVVPISVLLVVVGTVTPALYMRQDDGGILVLYGISPLTVGWVGICGMQFAWFANILLLRAWAAIRRDNYRAARRRLWFAAVLAANTFTWFLYSVPNDEGGVRMLRLERLGIGFYLWLAAILLPLAAIYWVQRPAPKGGSDGEKPGQVDP